VSLGVDTILSALIPIFALIVLGHGLLRIGVPGSSFWPQLERMVYYVLFPALLIAKLATAPVQAASIVPVAAAVAVTLAAMTVLVLALRRYMPVAGPGFTSIFQGSIRFNTYLGVAAAQALYGAHGVAVAALTLAVLIPLVNVLSVGILTRYAGGHKSLLKMARGIAQNPLIIACVIGIVLNRSGIGLPWETQAILEITGRAALPLGLMTVGAGLQLRMRWHDAAAVGWSLLLKLGAMPLLALIAALIFGLGGLEMRILVLFAALPTATSAYILARQLGGDHGLLASILTVEHVASALTLSVTLLLLG